VFTTSRSAVTLQLYSISCGFVVQLVSTVGKILTDIAVAEFLVMIRASYAFTVRDCSSVHDVINDC